MKKIIVYLCFVVYIIALTQQINAQNYRTIKSGSDAFFLPDKKWSIPNIKSQYYISSIRIDSTVISGNDTILYNLSEINKSSSKNALDITSWLGKKIILKPNKDNYFISKNNDTIIIITNAKLNESWKMEVFKDKSYINAYVKKIDTLTFLGIKDSVKYISLKFYDKNNTVINNVLNDKQIVISKNNGLIKAFNFRDFTDIIITNPIGVRNYSLLGLSNPMVGKQILTYKDIYNYDIGDEFHIAHTYNQGAYYNNSYEIIKIESKKIIADTFLYEAHKISWRNYLVTDPIHTYRAITEIFNDTNKILIKKTCSNLKIDSIYPLEYRSEGKYRNPSYYFMYPDSNYQGRIVILTINSDFSMDTSNYLMYDSGTEDITTYIEGCGTTSSYKTWDITMSESTITDLIYYKKGNDIYGNPLQIPSNIKENLKGDRFKVYPNPCSDLLTIEKDSEESAAITIYNEIGNIVFSTETKMNKSIVNIQAYPKGIYFVKILSDSKLELQKIVVQ